MRWLAALLILIVPTIGSSQWVWFDACGLMEFGIIEHERFSGPAKHIKGFHVWVPAVTHFTTFTPLVVNESKIECVSLWVGNSSLIVIGNHGDVMKKLRAAKRKRNQEGK